MPSNQSVMSVPDISTAPLEWITYWADIAENDLRFSGAADYKNRLPDHMETYLSGLSPDDPEDQLRRYGYCRAQYQLAHAAERQAAQDAPDASYDLIARTPIPITLGSGRRVEITSKSVSAYARMGDLHHAYVLMDEAVEELTERLTLTTLPLLRRVRRAQHQILDELLAIALHPDPDPPADAEPPAWSRLVTWEDLMAIQAAHIAVGIARYSMLPDPTVGRNEKADPARQGFGFFIASIAKQRRKSAQEILREDWWRLLAEIKMTAEEPSPDDVDDLEKIGLL